MAAAPRILVFAGSTRAESFNKKLARLGAEAARAAGGDATLIDLRDYSLPLFDADLEQERGLPSNGRRLKDLFLAHDGLLLACPEYNSSITGLLKNMIDWVSRPEPGQPELACFVGKVAGLMSASPGALGGLRGLVHVRAILGNIKVLVIPDQVAIMRAHDAFTAEGALKDAKQQAAVIQVAATLVRTVAKLKA
jgi:NAD(P)H-dependent FMN reductase